MKNSVLLLFSILILVSCEDVKHPDMDKTIQELKSRKIVRISDEQINAEAEKIASKVFTQLKHGKLDSLQKSFLAEEAGFLRLISTKKECLSEIESQIFDAYEYNVSHKIPNVRNLQELPSGNYLYSEPFYRDSVFGGLFNVELVKSFVVKSLQTKRE